MEKEERENVCVSFINEICAKWGEVKSFVEQYHLDKSVASSSLNIFVGNAICHFRNILKCRKKNHSGQRFSETEAQWI